MDTFKAMLIAEGEIKEGTYVLTNEYEKANEGNEEAEEEEGEGDDEEGVGEESEEASAEEEVEEVEEEVEEVRGRGPNLLSACLQINKKKNTKTDPK